MKYTLLEMTQTILSSMDSDEVSSISDTPESLQVATVIRTAYLDLITRANLPEQFSLTTLDASGDNTKPTLMTLPETVDKVEWIRYDKQTVDDPYANMQQVIYLSPDTFLERMYQLDQTATNVGTFDHTLNNDLITFYYEDDIAPCYYTVFDDFTYIFDSYDSAVDTTLQKSKTLVYAKNQVEFSMTDAFIPALDESQFSLLLNEAKSLAWAELKQSVHQKAEVSSRRGWTHLQKEKSNAVKENHFDQLPNFGRRSSGPYIKMH